MVVELQMCPSQVWEPDVSSQQVCGNGRCVGARLVFDVFEKQMLSFSYVGKIVVVVDRCKGTSRVEVLFIFTYFFIYFLTFGFLHRRGILIESPGRPKLIREGRAGKSLEAPSR